MDKKIIKFKKILLVSGKVDSQSSVACLQEMTVLFAAMKTSDFNEKVCAKEIQALQKANLDALQRNADASSKNKGLLTTGKVLNSKQINKYLRQFPNPK